MLLLSHYEGSKVPIDCKCLTCGYTWPSAPQVLLRGNGKKQGGGCPKCANRVRKTDEEFARELAAIRPSILIESPYLNANKPVRCRCKVCGYTWEDTPHVLLQPSDSNCPAEAANHKKTTEEFAAQIAGVNPNIEILSPYKTARKPIRCRCRVHDFEWETTPDSLLSHPRCRLCVNDKLRAERARSQEEFRALLETVDPEIEIIGKYVNSFTPIACRCRKCSHEWAPQPVNLLAGYGCPECAGTKRLTRKELNRRLKAIRSDFVVMGKYKSRKKKLTVQCTHCGRSFEMTPENLLHGTRCSCQQGRHSSTQEEFVAELLEIVLQEKPLRHDRQLIGMELDMFFPEHKIAVEPGAWYYHQDKLDSDQEKRKACAERGIRLITVYYGTKGERSVNDKDVLWIESECVTDRDKVSMGKRILNMLGLTRPTDTDCMQEALAKAKVGIQECTRDRRHVDERQSEGE